MRKAKTWNRKKILVVFCTITCIILILAVRLGVLMLAKAEQYTELAQQLHERERSIKAERGKIIDANGIILADNKSVCTISVVYNQIEDRQLVIEVLTRELGIDREEVEKKVNKRSMREVIASNVEKDIGDIIRSYQLKGVKIDEDAKRVYPFGTMASKVLGFTGKDNQGIIGLEVKYEEILKGIPGQILTITDARGIELEHISERRLEPVCGNNLHISLDANIQLYAQQAAERVLKQKQAQRVSVLLLNPQNGEIYAMVNVPEFDLNDPFQVPEELIVDSIEDARNQMWRNNCINDTYEPGSVFKIITAAAGLEKNVVNKEDTFYCPGYKKIEDRKIRCHKVTGHGSENFTEGFMNSCNPVFIEVGMRIGSNDMYEAFRKFNLLNKTNIDLPGEAGTIMHKKDKIGQVELATIAFGQSFQVTPIRLAATISALINGGTMITPHLAVAIEHSYTKKKEQIIYPKGQRILSQETSDELKFFLEKVVSEGSGKRAYIEGYHIGGKTATSQTLPRSSNRYISSFLGFAPADDPKILGMVIIHDPKGVYYGGTIAAPVLKEIFENILPYMGIVKDEASL